jgi:hypothetical protein
MSLELVSEYIAKISKLSQSEMMWLLGWNVAGGDWERIGLSKENGQVFLLSLFQKLESGGGRSLVKQSATRLQQGLMALRVGSSFEDIQKEPPFRIFAQSSMETLMVAWQEGGEAAYTSAWEEIFRSGWEAKLQSQAPIQVTGGPGDSESSAWKVIGALDTATRVAAEHWWLRYELGFAYSPGMHYTRGNDHNQHFSVHILELPDGSSKSVHFLLPW